METGTPARDLIAELGHLCLGSRLRRLGEQLQAGVAEALRDAGIDILPAQVPVLHALSEGAMTVGALSERLDLSQPGITRSLAKLSGQGLVEVSKCQNDQRQRKACLTRSGTRALERLRTDFYPHINDAVAEACSLVSGDLLDDLGKVETALRTVPLNQRIKTRRDIRIRQ